MEEDVIKVGIVKRTNEKIAPLRQWISDWQHIKFVSERGYEMPWG